MFYLKGSIMKRLSFVVPVVGIAILFTLAVFSSNSNRIAVTNTGIDVVEVKTDGRASKLLLGQNGTGYFDRDSKIQIGDATIKFGRQIEVANTGSGVIQIAYQDTTGSERTMILGERGTGYLSKSTPFKIGDVSIRR